MFSFIKMDLDFELSEKDRYETIHKLYLQPEKILNMSPFLPINEENTEINSIIQKRPYRKDDLVSYYKIDPTLTLKKYSNYIPILDVKNNNGVYQIKTDSFTNGTIISFLLGWMYQNGVTDKYGLDGYNINYKTLVIENNSKLTGYQITNTSQYTLVDYFRDIPKNIIEVYHLSTTQKVPIIPKAKFLDIIKQVISNLLYLKTLNFKGNRVTVDNIAIVDGETDIHYHKIDNKSDVIALISNFDYAELKTEYNGNTYYFKPKNEINIQPVFKLKSGYYKLKSWSTFRINDLSGNQIPIEWDTVTFVISLLMIPEVYYLVITDLELERYLIRDIIHPDDIEYLLLKIRDIVKNKTKITYSLVQSTLKEIRFVKTV